MKESTKSLVAKELEQLLPFTTRVVNYYIDYCSKGSKDEKAYARCVLKRGRHVEEKQGELSHKLMFLEMRLAECLQNTLKENECLGDFKREANKVVEDYIREIQNY